MNIDMNRELFICDCENVEHQFIFSYFPDEIRDRQVYVTTFLYPETNVFKRIWKAIKYICGHRSMYGYFDEFIFNQRDAYKLVKILKYLDPDILKKSYDEVCNQ